jgi:DNA invertase Pin-like site-specific DNA recombinase
LKRKAIAYYRVSTSEQGRSGLGLEAQKQAVSAYVASAGLELVLEVEEIESGKRDDRPALHRAIAQAKRCKGVLVIAKLDRLSRSVAFVSSLMEGGVQFTAADQPAANELTIHILDAVAQAERKAIGERTRAALAAARARAPFLATHGSIRRALKRSLLYATSAAGSRRTRCRSSASCRHPDARRCSRSRMRST